MHSHHSHSGSYVSHAHDTLDDVVTRAHAMGFQQFCLTEHMPRYCPDFLYPEELDKHYTCQNLSQNFQKYTDHARSLQQHYAGKMKILVGFEVEGIDDQHIQESIALKNHYDLVVGSVHHVFGVPIDFDQQQWLKAREQAGSTRALYKAYFDLQYKVISEIRPNVVGHIDLIRLFQPKDDIDPDTDIPVVDLDLSKHWPEVWDAIVRNIRLAESYGALFEFNSAAVRKGWSTPYPQHDVAQAIIDYGGARFCLSDDSHGVDQVGLNYHKVWDYITNVLKLHHIYYLDLENGKTVVKEASVAELSKSPFWNQYV